MDIAILLYQGVTALDAIGPYEVLASMPEANVQFVAKEPGVITTHAGVPGLHANMAFADMPAPDIFLLPGGPDVSQVANDAETIAWIQQAHKTSKYSTSVCTGALILGAAGILDGLSATTHWMFHDALKDFGAIPTLQRVVREGKVFTAAGVSSGIDMALTLAAAEYGDDIAQEIQLIIEYDPEPPFNAGSPAKAPKHVIDSLQQKFAHLAP
ncbi:MAG: DJ-1/PfpI family protein [Gammaproteobacteria bacterium]|jgi:transcriptional regulator GlxA family with amidase domain|nr:DJ-1/PfpI family protein [Gammaproteobacteria bacterium]